ncbi:MAG TPA: TIGR04211 family SH3 domain-containing protein [Gammaproteobacteria bacterium]|nr:TIGR04211 family SH3 domain-containing protein [Gammaproteobacteria bacterium]
MTSMQKQTTPRLLFIVLLLISTHLSARNIQYVSDELTIPMRSGATNSHKILKFLKSGQAVEVLEVNEEKTRARIVLVEDESKTGWVETSLLMAQPSAREQLKRLKRKNQSLTEASGSLKKDLGDVNARNAELLNVQRQLEKKNQDLKNILARLRESSAEPIRIAEENEALEKQLAKEQSKNESLRQENAFLSDQNIKRWFMIGALVSIGSLILGLLITRINWKKKESWGGGF